MALPTFPIEHLAAQLAAHRVHVPPNALPFMFGDSRELANELLALVMQGRKKATAGLFWAWEADDGGPPKEGQVYIVHDWDGTAAAVIENRRVTIVPFDQVDAEFVAEEGEGDMTLASWRRDHWQYFSRECKRLGRSPSPTMPVVCQRFRILYPNGAG